MALGARKLQIIILGDGAVGKTSILKMYAEGKYTPSHITTIGKSTPSHTLITPLP